MGTVTMVPEGEILTTVRLGFEMTKTIWTVPGSSFNDFF